MFEDSSVDDSESQENASVASNSFDLEFEMEDASASIDADGSRVGTDFLKSFPDGSFPLKSDEFQKLFETEPKDRLTPTMECQFAIYCILNHPSIPRYVYSYIIKIINKILHGPKKDFFTDEVFNESRDHIQAELDKYFSSPKTKVIEYQHESRSDDRKGIKMEKASFVGMDVQRTVLEDMGHPSIYRAENLSLNKDTMWSINQPRTDEHGYTDLNDVVSASAYQEACARLEIDEESELAVPYSGYIDEIGTTANLRNPTQPFLIKCLIPKRQLQRYRLLAYIPCEVKSAAEKKIETTGKDKSMHLRNLHTALSALFEEFDEAARNLRQEKTVVVMGGRVKEVRLVPFLLFIVGDHKSQQANTCRYGNSSYASCIQCQIAPAWEADETGKDLSLGHVDTELVMRWNSKLKQVNEEIVELKGRLAGINGNSKDKKEQRVLVRSRLKGANATRKELENDFENICISPCDNAFFHFKSMPTPVYDGFPPDHLHVFMLGILKHAASAAFSEWSDQNKSDFDKFAKNLFHQNPSTARQRFARYPLDRGMTSLSLVTAKEWVGFWFVVLVVGHTNTGAEIFNRGFSHHISNATSKLSNEIMPALEANIKKTKSPEGPGNQMNKSKLKYFKALGRRPKPTLQSMLSLIEHLLIFHASVYKEDFSWSNEKEKIWKQKISYIVQNLPYVFPRIEGNGWKFPKLHLQQHLPYNVARFGSPRNFDAMMGEKALQEFAKTVSRTVAKNVPLRSFNTNLAKRLYEFNVQQNLLDPYRYSDVPTPFLDIAKEMYSKHTSSNETECDNHADGSEISTVQDTGGEDDANVIGPSNPHWIAQFQIIFLNANSEHIGAQEKVIYTLDQGTFTYPSSNQVLPELCKRELRRDLVRWMTDAAKTSSFEDHLPMVTDEDTVDGKPINVHGYFQAGMRNDSGTVDFIRCHPNFYQGGPRYDFVMQDHTNYERRSPDKFGASPESYSPSKLLLLYRNPLDATMRAVLHTCTLSQEHNRTPTLLVEHHTLEVKMMSREDGTLFQKDGEVLDQRATTLALRKCNIVARRSPMPVCMGASLQEITCSQFVVAENNTLEMEYDSQDDVRLKLVYIRDPQYWTAWMEPDSP